MSDNNTEPLPLDELRVEYDRLKGFDVETFVFVNLKVAKEGAYKNGSYRWLLEMCPFNRSASIIKGVTGYVSFRCFHNSCKNKTWGDVLALFPPDDQHQEDNQSES